MVDKLLFCDDTTAQTAFRVPEENVLVFNGVLSEAGIMENIAQTAAASAGYLAKTENKPVAVGYIGAVKNFEVFDLPVVNDELNTEVKIESRIFDMTIIFGMVKVDGKLMAQCEMNIFSGK